MRVAGRVADASPNNRVSDALAKLANYLTSTFVPGRSNRVVTQSSGYYREH